MSITSEFTDKDMREMFDRIAAAAVSPYHTDEEVVEIETVLDETMDINDLSDDYHMIEIGPFGKLDHDLPRCVLTDTWMDNEGTISMREIEVGYARFRVESAGRTVYVWHGEFGDWFGSERIRRDLEQSERTTPRRRSSDRAAKSG